MFSFLSAALYSYKALRTVASIGAVLTAPMFEWTQRAFNPEIHLVAPCGSTDIANACKS